MLGDRPILCAVLDSVALGDDPADRAEAIFRAGVDWIQLRDRTREDADLYALLAALVGARDHANDRPSRVTQHRVIMNKRVDLARATAADGVHLGFDALDASTARALLGPEALIGASLHSVEEVEAAAGATGAGRGIHREGDREFGSHLIPDLGSHLRSHLHSPLHSPLHYAHLAPIWNPLSKPASRPPLGLDALAAACRAGLPVLAQGGVDAQHAGEAIRAGAAGVAVTGILAGQGAVEQRIRPLREALDLAGARSGG